MKSAILFVLALTLTAICFAQSNNSESLTITTYYPAPYGVYRNLKLNPTDSMPTGSALSRGVIFYNNSSDHIEYLNKTGWVNVSAGLPGPAGPPGPQGPPGAGAGGSLYNCYSCGLPCAGCPGIKIYTPIAWGNPGDVLCCQL